MWGQEKGTASSPEVTREPCEFWAARLGHCISVPGALGAWRRVGEVVHLLSRILGEHTEERLWQQTRGVHLCLCLQRAENKEETPVRHHMRRSSQTAKTEALYPRRASGATASLSSAALYSPGTARVVSGLGVVIGRRAGKTHF